MKYHCYLLAFLCIGMSACKKSSSTTTTAAKSNTDDITQKAWVLVAERTNTDNGAWTDVYSSYPACQKDNQLSFASNGTYSNNEGATKCSTTAPQVIQTGTWAFTNSGTHLSISQPSGSSADLAIEQLDDGTLKMLQEVVSGGHDYKDEATYVHP